MSAMKPHVEEMLETYSNAMNEGKVVEDKLTNKIDRKSVVQGKSVDLGGRRIIKKKKKKNNKKKEREKKKKKKEKKKKKKKHRLNRCGCKNKR